MNNFRGNHAMQTTGNTWLQGKFGIGRGDFSSFLDDEETLVQNQSPEISWLISVWE